MRTQRSVSIGLPAPLEKWLTKEAAAWGKSRSGYITWLLERERDTRLSERVQILEKTLERMGNA